MPDEATSPAPWTRQSWMDDAACRGRTQLFFAPHAERPQARVKREARVRKVCQSCPVVFDCRRYARTHLEHGFWGGESEEERADAGYPAPAPTNRRRSAS